VSKTVVWKLKGYGGFLIPVKVNSCGIQKIMMLVNHYKMHLVVLCL